MKKLKDAIKLFLIFFKIGLLTFGGGYAMISIIEEEFVSKKKYITQEELLKMLAIAESTPGPIAINSATYIGYKRAGFLGSLFATLGVTLPSFIIIYIISLFFDEFLKLEIVKKAFLGIKCGVGVLIINAGIKMFKKLEKTPLTIILFSLCFVLSIIIGVFSLNISAIYFIVVAGVVGITVCKILEKGENK